MAKLLVIDDEMSIRETLKDVLEYEGYEVETAESGMEGLALFEKEEYDVVLSDVKMPQIDGLEVLEYILRYKPGTPVIMITGHADVEMAVQALKLGAFDFLEKPIDMNHLLVAIHKGIEEKENQRDMTYNDLVSNRDVDSSLLRSSMNDIQYVYDKKGNKESVLLPIRIWNRIMNKKKNNESED